MFFYDIIHMFYRMKCSGQKRNNELTFLGYTLCLVVGHGGVHNVFNIFYGGC